MSKHPIGNPPIKWIKCDDMLPEITGNYIVQNDPEKAESLGIICKFDAVGKTWKDLLGRDSYPHYWMPIPETSADNMPTKTKEVNDGNVGKKGVIPPTV